MIDQCWGTTRLHLERETHIRGALKTGAMQLFQGPSRQMELQKKHSGFEKLRAEWLHSCREKESPSVEKNGAQAVSKECTSIT